MSKPTLKALSFLILLAGNSAYGFNNVESHEAHISTMELNESTFPTMQSWHSNEYMSPAAENLANSESIPSSIAQKLQQKILQKLDGKADIGVKLWSLNSGQSLFVKNSSETFTPASNTKIFTAVAALLSLGSQYTFKTSLLTSNHAHLARNTDTLHGDLYLKFSGDPSLTQAHLTKLIAALRDQGIHNIQGNVYIDDSAFNGASVGPGWNQHDLKFCYAAPVSSAIINHNCASTLNHGDVSYKKKNSHSRFSKKHAHPWRKKHARYVSHVVKEPSRYARDMLSHLLARAKISYEGSVSYHVAPQNARILTEHHSAPLSTLLKTMLKRSDNLFADAIFKKIGSVYFNQPGNWSNSAQAVKRILATQAHLNTKNLILMDGSGLSHYNSATPEHVISLLNFAYQQLPNGTDFILALPISGIDGTLAHRLRHPAMQGRVRAKTGTMKQISALSGYLETHHQDVLIFSIIINGFAGSCRDYRAIADELLIASAHYY